MSDSDVIIKIENLGKQYKIGHQNKKERYHSLRDTIAQTCKYFIRTTKDILTGQPVIQGDTTEEIWALKDVNFEVNCGESLGIIGRNGAGKSTLLKILSRITEPTTGKVTIKGRVASLLEVGTGFHPELTGRENIFLNGAILGMTYKEIKSRFDEIVAFAEVEKYLDTPVKRYSSGMYVRLAFSVAAHLEPDILIVDEVLAVGDSFFQKKCIDKMLEAKNENRTVLFVSHNFSAIKSFCDSAALINKGELSFIGNVDDAICLYQKGSSINGPVIDLQYLERDIGLRELIFSFIEFITYPLLFGKKITFKCRLSSSNEYVFFAELEIAVEIRNKDQIMVLHLSNKFINSRLEHNSDSSEYFIEFENILKPGDYFLSLYLRTSKGIQDHLLNKISIRIEGENPYGFHDPSQFLGIVLPQYNIYKK